MNWDDFLHADAKLSRLICWLKLLLINFWVVMVIIGYGTLISEWMDEFSWFFAYSYIFGKAKSYFNSFGVVLVKNTGDLLGYETLKSAVFQERIDESS